MLSCVIVLFQVNDGLTFRHTILQQAEVTSWDSTPCIIKPESCTSGASVVAWLKIGPNCPEWGGIGGSQESASTEGLAVQGRLSGTGMRYL